MLVYNNRDLNCKYINTHIEKGIRGDGCTDNNANRNIFVLLPTRYRGGFKLTETEEVVVVVVVEFKAY